MSEVLVLGAGMAGLSAALRLLEEGITPVLLEARDRVGGRIHTVQAAGCDVELGAEFIHGTPQETFERLQRYGLQHYELEGDNVAYDRAGQLHTSEEGSFPTETLDQMTAWADTHPAQDLSFDAWAAAEQIPEEQLPRVRGFIEGFNAADARAIGVQGLARQQHAEEEIEGWRGFHVRGGYAQLPQKMAEELQSRGVQLVQNAEVQQITWQRHAVTVTLHDGRTFAAQRCVVAVPLGVLQGRRIVFEPRIPQILRNADQLRVGPAVRVSMCFRKRWWQPGALSFLLPGERHAEDGAPRFEVFWTPHPGAQPMITAWAAGRQVEAFTELSQAQWEETAITSLVQALGCKRAQVEAELVEVRSHNWRHDVLAGGGAYTWVPAGALPAVEALGQPLGDTLFFAGEHTDATGHWGTVHGAIRSGVRVARQVAASLPRHK